MRAGLLTVLGHGAVMACFVDEEPGLAGMKGGSKA